MKQGFLLLSLFLFLLLNVPTLALINEVMYNPIGNDAGREWIEIYNNNDFEINLSGWKLYEGGTNHGLSLKQGSFVIQPKDYAVIADDWSVFKLDYPDFDGTLIDSVFSLSNTNETLVLKNSLGDVIVNFTYYSTLGGNGNGFSISLVNGNWRETLPTPGKDNKIAYINQTGNQTNNQQNYNQQNNILNQTNQEVINNKTLNNELNQISLIKIIDSPESAYFGDLIYITFFVYKGNTSKYAIYAYVENEDSVVVSNKNTTHFKGKFVNNTFIVPVQLNPKCYEKGNYFIVIEGLDLREEKPINLENKQSCEIDGSVNKTTKNKKFSYELSHLPEYVYVNEEFEIQVRIETSEETEIEIWSYVYRGSKSYSGEREENKQRIHLSANSTTTVNLKNKITDAKPGDYKLKINIKKDDLKTLKEITSNITVLSKEEIKVMSEIGEDYESPKKDTEERIYKNSEIKPDIRDLTALSVIVYESPQTKAEKLVVYLMLGLFTLTIIFLAFKRM